MTRSVFSLIVAIALAGAAAGLAGFSVVPHFTQWRALAGYSEALERAVTERSRLVRQVKEVLAQSTEASSKEELTLFLPSNKDAAGLIAIISGGAASRGVILEEIGFPQEEAVSFGQMTPTTPYRTLNITVKALGLYSSLRSFLEALAESVRLLDVKRFAVTTQEGSDVMRLEAELISYYRPQ